MNNLKKWEDKLRLWQLLHPGERIGENNVCNCYCKFSKLSPSCRYLKKLRMRNTGTVFVYTIKDGTDEIGAETLCVEFIRYVK
jgi:hypothetical protein